MSPSWRFVYVHMPLDNSDAERVPAAADMSQVYAVTVGTP
jgi:hypothetical protein